MGSRVDTTEDVVDFLRANFFAFSVRLLKREHVLLETIMQSSVPPTDIDDLVLYLLQGVRRNVNDPGLLLDEFLEVARVEDLRLELDRQIIGLHRTLDLLQVCLPADLWDGLNRVVSPGYQLKVAGGRGEEASNVQFSWFWPVVDGFVLN